METIIDLALKNIPWIFSGVGIFILGLITTRKIHGNTKHSRQCLIQTQKESINSINIQSGRDININASLEIKR